MSAKSSTEQEKVESISEPVFTCHRCGRQWSVKQMRRLTRFRPVIVVCPDCEKSFL